MAQMKPDGRRGLAESDLPRASDIGAGRPRVLKSTGPQGGLPAAAAGLAIPAMYVTGTFHPPAGINPLPVFSGNLPSTFLPGTARRRRSHGRSCNAKRSPSRTRPTLR
jgi:hypothetical protein